MKKTKYNNQKINVKATILGTIFLIFIFLVSAIFFYKTLNSINNQEEKITSILYLFISGFLMFFIFIGILGAIFGLIKAKIMNLLDKIGIRKNNPYIYYRELPNNYGIGIATILMDSTIENEKDIVAVILDLCARGYLNLKKIGDKYTLNILKNIDDKLLQNEKYIMNLIINGSIKDINYKEWFDFCLQDGIDLSLFEKKENYSQSGTNHFKTRAEKTEKATKIYVKTVSIISALLAFCVFWTNIKDMRLVFAIISSIFYFLLIAMFLFVILFIPLYGIPVFIIGIFSIATESKEQSFKTERLKSIKLTEKGKEETQKLYAFKGFIKDFGMFANKNPEEIVLWEYYLSYAQVFGLTKEILSTGYDKIVKNSSFEIENIESIDLKQIDIDSE